MTKDNKDKKRRILIYSHDTFGLGHIRRCRAIAHALVEKYKGLSVLILSGSPIISRFEFKARVDFVRVPGVIKLKDGRYTSLGLHIDLKETLAIRESIIRHTAKVYQPDLFIVDKEPLGLHGEIEKTLHMLKERGTKNILGLRDILDSPEALKKEWKKKKALKALDELYHDIWIYGAKEFYNPLVDIKTPSNVVSKIHYMGYIKRNTRQAKTNDDPIIANKVDKPFLLVTSGGGKDGKNVYDLIFKAYQSHNDLPYFALLVLGPFISKELCEKYHRMASELDNVYVVNFHNNMETLISHCSGMVCMGGYNTFCEILSFDKPSIIIPRNKPRLEQTIRANQAQHYQLCRTFDIDNEDTDTFVQMLKEMPEQNRPSKHLPQKFLDGKKNICQRTLELMDLS